MPKVISVTDLDGKPIPEDASIIDFLEPLEASLRFLGPEFRLAWSEVWHYLERANNWKEARIRDGPVKVRAA